MRQVDRQWREPLVLVEEEHELDRDHREQWDEERKGARWAYLRSTDPLAPEEN
jgi:hypothetical protein